MFVIVYFWKVFQGFLMAFIYFVQRDSLWDLSWDFSEVFYAIEFIFDFLLRFLWEFFPVEVWQSSSRSFSRISCCNFFQRFFDIASLRDSLGIHPEENPIAQLEISPRVSNETAFRGSPELCSGIPLPCFAELLTRFYPEVLPSILSEFLPGFLIEVFPEVF